MNIKLQGISLILWTLASVGFSHDPWGENQRAKINTDYVSSNSNAIYRFLGNQTHKDYFKLLRRDGNSLLIGARNVIYNVSLPDLVENIEQRITWTPSKKDVDICLVKGRSEDDCQNYIRVLARTKEDQLLVCGTNAFKPKYRIYTKNGSSYHVSEEFSGSGICPYDPRHNSTAIYSDGEIYSGTVADFSGRDSIIYRDRVRTVQSNLKQLNNPDFIGSMEDEDHIYFFFRESAVEYINCGKTIYSRVARICKNDNGGPHKFQNGWTTFLKTRLNCSVPGHEQPFFFNEIQSMTPVDSDLPVEDRIIYGVFTTPDNSISGSAICAFKMSSVVNAFDGDFRDQDESNSLWLPIPKSRTPSHPRPGTCYNDSRALPSSTLNFARLHNLMAQNVNPVGDRPLFVKTSLGERLTVIASDARVRDVLEPRNKFDVLFVGTTGGRVLKIVNSVLIESMQIYPYHVPVRNLMVLEDHLVILSDHEVSSIPLQRCSHPSAQSCGDCVALQDPYCAWNVLTSECVPHKGQDISKLLQNVEFGFHSGCPESSYSESVAQNASFHFTSPTSSTSAVTISTTSSMTDPSGLSSSSTKSPSASCPITHCDCSSSKAHTFSSHDREKSSQSENADSSQVPYFDNVNEEGSNNQYEVPRQFNKNYGPRFYPPTAYKDRNERTIYTEKTLALATISAAFTALLIGFLGGYFISKRCEKPLKLEFLERRAGNLKAGVGRGGVIGSGGELGLDSGYATPSNLNSTSTNNTNSSTNNSKSINLLVNVPPKSETIKASPIQGSGTNNIISSPGNNQNINTTPGGSGSNVGTLQKVKRIYI
ncbi:semaphorin-1A isoform X1 [Lepeophtheirus salmonis]|uniref:semaphorin-1A isoform X1 n=2 Tax=Lepeophtheirus salmonis TaxID=72036 RepID=UPI001AE8CC99|nr:semaphorin-1A-like isoform X1 [Lepeophtheirus salmonis]